MGQCGTIDRRGVVRRDRTDDDSVCPGRFISCEFTRLEDREFEVWLLSVWEGEVLVVYKALLFTEEGDVGEVRLPL
jgi:hypothetical protein